MANKINDHAPLEGCSCDICYWANRRIECERRDARDLEANYQLYLAGALVSRDDRE